MMVHEEKKRQFQLLKWLTIALVLKLVYLDVFPGAYYVQHLLMYVAFYKSLSYYEGVSHAKHYIWIGFGLLLMIRVIEEECKPVGSTARIMKKYMWLAITVIASWTFLMNLDYFSQMVLLFMGAVILFGINVKVLIHLRSLKKHIKSTMHFVTYT